MQLSTTECPAKPYPPHENGMRPLLDGPLPHGRGTDRRRTSGGRCPPYKGRGSVQTARIKKDPLPDGRGSDRQSGSDPTASFSLPPRTDAGLLHPRPGAALIHPARNPRRTQGRKDHTLGAPAGAAELCPPARNHNRRPRGAALRKQVGDAHPTHALTTREQYPIRRIQKGAGWGARAQPRPERPCHDMARWAAPTTGRREVLRMDRCVAAGGAGMPRPRALRTGDGFKKE